MSIVDSRGGREYETDMKYEMGHRFLVTKLDCIGAKCWEIETKVAKKLLGMLSRTWMLLNYGAQFFKTFITAQTERKFTFAIINDDELSLRQAAFLPREWGMIDEKLGKEAMRHSGKRTFFSWEFKFQRHLNLFWVEKR